MCTDNFSLPPFCCTHIKVCMDTCIMYLTVTISDTGFTCFDYIAEKKKNDKTVSESNDL